MPYRLVVFDWDGTLTDSVAQISAAIRLAIERAGLPPRGDDAIREVIGLGMSAGIAHLYPQAPGAARLALARVQADADVRSHVEQAAPLFPGVPDLLEGLARQGTLLAIATGKSRAGLERDLGAGGVAAYFAATRSADDGPGKPAPRPLLDLLHETGTQPGEAVVVGDTLYDLQMARAAGVAAIGVGWGVHSREQLHSAAPKAVVGRIAELETLLIGPADGPGTGD